MWITPFLHHAPGLFLLAPAISCLRQVSPHPTNIMRRMDDCAGFQGCRGIGLEPSKAHGREDRMPITMATRSSGILVIAGLRGRPACAIG